MFPQDILIRRLKGDLPDRTEFAWANAKSDEEVGEVLRQLSGLDFGTDVAAWENWWIEECRRMGRTPET